MALRAGGVVAVTWRERWPHGADRRPVREFLGPLSATPSRAQLRAHRAALARRFGLRRSEVRATVWRSTAWRAFVVALRVRGRPTLTTCDGGAEGTRRALRWLRSVAP